MDEKEKEYFEVNQKLWDAKTKIHVGSQFYNMEAFLAGENSLRKIELDELPSLEGRTILHSQCHFGQDTLSMQRMGGQCTGIDLSGKAIAQAKALNEQLGLSAKFVQTNVYEIDKHVEEQFDIVFTSYGVVGWLPDLDRWAYQLMSRLKSGGTFYIVEFHPSMYQYNWDNKQLEYSYFNSGEPTLEVEEGTYADRDSEIKLKEYYWQHSFSEIFNALIKYGLVVESFNEFNYSPYQIFGTEVKRAEQEYLFQVNEINLPLVFSLKGIKK